MYTVIQVIGWWFLISCTVGPVLTWCFFRFEREEREGTGEMREARDREAVVDFDRWAASMSVRRASRPGVARSLASGLRSAIHL